MAWVLRQKMQLDRLMRNRSKKVRKDISWWPS